MLHRLAVVDLMLRDIDRHGKPAATGCRPSGRFLESRQESGGRGQRPSAHRNDQPRLLGKRDEGPGRHQPRARVLPSHERLETDQALVGQRDERLEVKPKLALVEPLAQLVLQLQLGHGIP